MFGGWRLRRGTELRRPPAAAACAARPPSGDCIVLSYPLAMPEAASTVPGTMNSGRNGCRTGSLCWPRAAACGGARSQRGGCELVEPLRGYSGASNGLAVGGRYASITEDPWGGCVQPAAIHRGQARRCSGTAAAGPPSLSGPNSAKDFCTIWEPFPRIELEYL